MNLNGQFVSNKDNNNDDKANKNNNENENNDKDSNDNQSDKVNDKKNKTDDKSDKNEKFQISDNDNNEDNGDTNKIYLNSDDDKNHFSDISLNINPYIKQGKNILKVQVLGEPGSSVDISIDGFIKAHEIPDAVHSLIPDTPEIRLNSKIEKGIIGIKFLEGMKVRLQLDSTGKQKLVDFNGTSLSSEDFFVADMFGYLYIAPDKQGDYRFHVGHDDGAILEIDNDVKIGANFPTPYREDSSGLVNLSSGCHKIRLMFSEIGFDAALSLSWTRPDGVKAFIPANVLFRDASVPFTSDSTKSNPQLIGRFFDGNGFEFGQNNAPINPPYQNTEMQNVALYPFISKLFPKINFVNPNANYGDVYGIGRIDYFSAFFSGYVKLPQGMPEGKYNFIVGHDDGAVLYIDGKAMIYAPGPYDYQEDVSSAVFLKHNEYHQIVLTYNENGGEAELGLFWKKEIDFPNQRTVIPEEALTH